MENSKSHGKVMEFIPWFLEFSPTMVDNSSNLRQVKLPDLTMGTICVIAFSSLLHCLDFLRGFASGKIMENMGKVVEKSWHP